MCTTNTLGAYNNSYSILSRSFSLSIGIPSMHSFVELSDYNNYIVLCIDIIIISLVIIKKRPITAYVSKYNDIFVDCFAFCFDEYVPRAAGAVTRWKLSIQIFYLSSFPSSRCTFTIYVRISLSHSLTHAHTHTTAPPIYLFNATIIHFRSL